jgi:hypothetical protein
MYYYIREENINRARGAELQIRHLAVRRHFTTSFPRGTQETWIMSRYDPEQYVIQFVVIHPEAYVMKFDVALQDSGDGTTLVQLTNTFTGLTDSGNAFVAHYTQEAYASAMTRLFEALDHYCRTGEMLKR